MNWEELYTLYSEKIYSFLFFLTFDETLAEDLMQETFVRAHIAHNSFRGQASELTWLRTIARNLLFDQYKRKKVVRFVPFIGVYDLKSVTLSAEALLHMKEDVRSLYIALASLKFEYRAAITLRKIEELSIKETADILGWNEAKVRNNTERGLKALKVAMKGDGFEWMSSSNS